MKARHWRPRGQAGYQVSIDISVLLDSLVLWVTKGVGSEVLIS